jgi:MFS family permease
VVLLDLIGFGIVIPILPFISPRLGASDFDIAMIIASYALFASIAAPFWGRLSDRMGRKPVLMICTVGAAGAYLLLAFADQLWMVFAARAFAGIMAGNFAVASAVMADITPPSERASGMGLIGAAFGLGLVLGPVLGGLLSGPEGSFFLPCALASAMSLLAVLAAGLFLPESHKPGTAGHRVQSDRKSSLWAMLRASQCRLLMLQYFLHTSSVSAITYLWPLWVYALLDWSAQEVGIVFGVQGAIMALTQGVMMGPLVRFFGELRLLRICVSLFFLGLVIAVFAAGPVAMTGSALIALSGATLCMPVLNSFVSQRGGGMQVGRLMGVGAAAASWGRVAGPLLAGVLLTWGGFRIAWHLPLAMVAVYLLWAFSHWAARPAHAAREAN